MRFKTIPDETISRLFPYMRALVCLNEKGAEIVSSNRLSKICMINSAIIRKDFSYFGEFGKRGVGYNVPELLAKIRKILKLEEYKKVALIGTGNIGRAILSYNYFPSEGFKIVLAFDKDVNKIGSEINGIRINDIQNAQRMILDQNVEICIVATPVDETSKVINMLSEFGIDAFLSFSPCRLNLPDNVKVTCMDLSTELAKLAYYSNKEIEN
ncbi:MAG: redox-sensing transcriptional repressor Rex [Candidatus Marinimicrobia bacterium]|nr:redox-sensing transcriptional repressor Rex [Candidatus Neomarinimicrobiota bacterium]